MKCPQVQATHVWSKKLLRQYIFGIIGFAVLMFIAIFFFKNTHAHIIVKIIMALSPVVPFLVAMNAFVKNFKSMDELYQKIFADALIMTAIITMALSMILGMFQIFEIIANFSIFYLFPFMMVTWSFSFAYYHIKINGLNTVDDDNE